MPTADAVSSPAEIVSTQYAAHLVGVSVTYFRQLAQQPEPVVPHRLKGSHVLVWTPAQVSAVKQRVKGRL